MAGRTSPHRGIVDLLAGGLLIGPRGLDIVTHSNTSVAALGQIGLLYLTFLAGVELDLGVFRRLRNSALVFGAVTFSLPMALTSAAMLVLAGVSGSITGDTGDAGLAVQIGLGIASLLV